MATATDGDVDRALAAMGASAPLKYHSFGVITVRPPGSPAAPASANAGLAGGSHGASVTTSGAATHGSSGVMSPPHPQSAAAAVFPLLGRALPEAFQIGVEPEWPSGSWGELRDSGEVAPRPVPPAAQPPSTPTFGQTGMVPPTAGAAPFSPFAIPSWLEPAPPSPPPLSPAPPSPAPQPTRQAGSPETFALPPWLEPAPPPVIEPARPYSAPASAAPDDDETIRPTSHTHGGAGSLPLPPWLEPGPAARPQSLSSLASEQQSFASPVTPPPPAPAHLTSGSREPDMPPSGHETFVEPTPLPEPPAWVMPPPQEAEFAARPPAHPEPEVPIFRDPPAPLPSSAPPSSASPSSASPSFASDPELHPVAPALTPRKPLADLFRALGARPAASGGETPGPL